MLTVKGLKSVLMVLHCYCWVQLITNNASISQVAALQPTTPSSLSSLTSSPIPSWGGWRVALNIGREPLTTMPRSWASSGARFPLVMQCNFTDDGRVASISGDVRYTVTEGEMIKPVQAGTWTISKNNRDISFSLIFPETMIRNGVEILSQSEIICEGLLYTKTDLKALDQDFYNARSVTDDINAQVKETKRKREAPKKWNFETKKWEKRYKDESSIVSISKKMKQLAAGVVEKRQSNQRPNPSDLSIEPGQFPGVDCDVFMGKGGKVKIKGAVVGTWGAEPINDNPASYYRSSY